MWRNGRRHGLKIRWEVIPVPVRVRLSAPYIAGWSSLVARRAHNPKVVWFKSRPRNQKNPTRKSWIFSFVPLGTTSFAWHTQHHFERSENIILLVAQMNDVEALPQMKLPLANDVGLRPTMLRFAQTELSCSLGALKCC